MCVLGAWQGPAGLEVGPRGCTVGLVEPAAVAGRWQMEGQPASKGNEVRPAAARGLEPADRPYAVKRGSLCPNASLQDSDPLSEADLSSIWAGQRFPAEALQTPDGRAVRVLNPGRPNFGAGPDFRDAVLEIAGEPRHGDVELHVRASFFRAHGHSLDHAYERVALHVVYLADDGLETLLANGRRAPVACFAPWLLGRTEELQSWLTAPALWQDPCRSAAARLGEAGVAAALRAAGERRFQARLERLAASVALVGAEQALWMALLEALGVGGDREGFRRLAAAFPASLARLVAESAGAESRSWLTGALLTVAGLGEAPEEIAALLPRALSPPIARLGRPLNWPERRLAALAGLYARADRDLAGYVERSVSQAEKARDLVAAWQVGAVASGPALLGQERAREMVLNLVLPFAATRPFLRQKALAFLTQLPASGAYGRTAFLEANLAGVDGQRRVRSALEQQGLLALVDEWCKQGGCGRCPLS